MKRLILILLTASVTVSGQIEPIKHAPTVQQCQADRRLWSATIEGDETLHPRYLVLANWFLEMADCEKVDPDRKLMYFNTADAITEYQAVRMQHYLVRHRLWDEFLREDAAGKR